MNRIQLITSLKSNTVNFSEVVLSYPIGDTNFYGNWMAQTYKYVVHSAPLIKKCADLLPPGELKDKMNHHYKDEVGHEKFALLDAKHFGIDAEAVETLPATQKMYEFTYNSIDESPYAMLGYGLALESLSQMAGPILAKKVVDAYEINVNKNPLKNAPGSFIILHAEVDQEHAEEGQEAIDLIPEDKLEFVHDVMVQTFENYANFISEIAARFSSKAA